MSTITLLCIALAGVIMLLLLVIKAKVQPFVALLLVSLLVALAAGIPAGEVGKQDLAELAADNQAFLLANHGPVVCGESLQEAANNMEELEETAKLIFILGDRPIRYLTAGEIAELRS